VSEVGHAGIANSQPSPKAPTTYKSYWYITIPITLLLLLAWHNRSSVAGYIHGGAGSYPGITVATELSSSPLDSEAKIEATKVFEGLVTKCGDKYYIWNDQGGQHGWPIEFMEKPVLSIGSLPVSEEARLNGLTWQGRVDFSSSADKILWPHQEGHWSLGQSHSFSLFKTNGVWVYESYMGDKSPSDSFSDNIPCDKVLERLSQEGVSKTDSQQEPSPTQQAIVKDFTMLDNAAKTWDHANISSRFSWLVDNGYSPSYRDFQWSTLPSNITDSFVKWYRANQNV
jgi:hypothetical protein